MNKNTLIYVFLFITGFGTGYLVHSYIVPPRIVQVDKEIIKQPIIVQGEGQQTSTTIVRYVPKEETPGPDGKAVQEKTDAEITVGKPSFTLKLNGKEQTFSRTDDERYVFDKNKLTLDQQSRITFDLRVPPQVINNTKTGGIDLIIGRYSGIGIQINRIGFDFTTNGQDRDIKMRWKAVQW